MIKSVVDCSDCLAPLKTCLFANSPLQQPLGSKHYAVSKQALSVLVLRLVLVLGASLYPSYLELCTARTTEVGHEPTLVLPNRKSGANWNFRYHFFLTSNICIENIWKRLGPKLNFSKRSSWNQSSKSSAFEEQLLVRELLSFSDILRFSFDPPSCTCQ